MSAELMMRETIATQRNGRAAHTGVDRSGTGRTFTRPISRLVSAPAPASADFFLVFILRFHSQLLLAEETYDNPSFERRAVARAPGRGRGQPAQTRPGEPASAQNP